MIQVERKAPKELSMEERVDTLNYSNAQLLMNTAMQDITIQQQQGTIANLLLEVAMLKAQVNPTTPQ